ncbi:tetratricopeptide (TPR) repeat protein [Allocatelliglobosispora scoriae]|uniref:Tetratricopeptide (TPR) repeat protein n=1 Tax=Allocatelliglobosispora scoriae TaxID=643052 RepID=A0A841BIW2_9ACTN|nr:helix-turn-helix transcriptional regulator [Allocatelliglobosispora scoriae]MBB5869057.1 tetratricopeptide (TPR) repeat protein [Allocatelliglobosispora scoriae]
MSQPSQSTSAEFPRRLRALRTARGITQRQLAGDNLSVSYVSLLETGRRSPGPEVLQQLADRLSCSVEELRGDIETSATRPAALAVRFGQLALESGRAEEALDHFGTVLRTTDLDPLLRSDARIGAARALEAAGRLEEAARAYETLVQEAIDAPTYLASLGVVLSWCGCLFELGQLNRVVEVGVGAMQQFDRLDAWDSDGAIQLLATVASAHFELGDVGQAERLLQEGLARANRMHSPRARASVLWNASQIASERGRHREALDLAEEALAYFRHGSDRRSTARLLGAYGYLLLRQDPPRPVEAKEALQEALAGLTDSGRGFDRGSILVEISRSHLMIGDPSSAVDAARQSLVEAGPEATLQGAQARTALGAALAAIGDADGATVEFARAAEELGRIHANREAARAWAELGNVLAEAGDAHGAVRAFRHATAELHLVQRHQSTAPASPAPLAAG